MFCQLSLSAFILGRNTARSRHEHRWQHGDDFGVIIPLFALFIFVAFAILAMLVEHSKESLALTTLQRAADSAALAGARKLNGSLNGWREAKRSSVVALKRNPLHGLSTEALQSIQLTQGPSQFEIATAEHRGSESSAQGLNVKVERGVVWFNTEINDYRFTSLESKKDFNDKLPQDGQAYMLANAVRVRLRLESLTTTFGRIFGVESYDDLQREAIAVSHEELELPVAPIAIPLCSLLLDTDPQGQRNKSVLDEVNLNTQCIRQGLATEADPKRELNEAFGPKAGLPPLSQDEKKRRREGLARWEAHTRPVYYHYDDDARLNKCFSGVYGGLAANCLNLPLYGTLGIPTASPDHETTAEEVAAAFSGGITARPGMFFAPLTSLADFANKPRLSKEIADALNSEVSNSRHNASVPFADVFTDPLGPNGERVAKRNFPFLRTRKPDCGGPGAADDQFDPELRPCVEDDPAYDRRISWPMPYLSGGSQLIGRELVNPNREPLDYTNPTCHHPDIPIDALTSANPNRHRVRRMLAPVIAPSVKTTPDGKEVTYCQYAEVFASSPTQNSVAPVPPSRPVIVGFVPIFVYDFNLSDLDRVPQFQPPAGGLPPLLDFGGEDLEEIADDIWDLEDMFEDVAVPADTWDRVSTPRYRDPVTGKEIVDMVPAELEISENSRTRAMAERFKQYQEDHKEWRSCVNNTEQPCEPKKPKPLSEMFLGMPVEFLYCFDFSPLLKNPQFGNVLQQLDQIQAGTCTRKINTPTGPKEESYSCIKEEQQILGFLKIIDDFFNENIPAQPYTHCIPRENLEDEYETKDRNDPFYYQHPLDTVRLGFGCGGVQFKTACEATSEDDSIFIPAGLNHGQTSPALVVVDAEESEERAAASGKKRR